MPKLTSKQLVVVGDIDAASFRLRNLSNPLLPQDAATLATVVASTSVLVRNETGSPLGPGPVRVVGYSAATGRFLIGAADADGASPASILLLASLPDGANGDAYPSGDFTYDTSGRAVGDPCYLSATAGAVTFTAPTGPDQVVQAIGSVKAVGVGGTIAGRVEGPTRAGISWLQGPGYAGAMMYAGPAPYSPTWSTAANTPDPTANVVLYPSADAMTPLVVQGRPTQVANLVEIQSSSGAQMVYISALGQVSIMRDNIQSTDALGLDLANSTLATAVITEQRSPGVRFLGHVWNSGGAADEEHAWTMQVELESSATPSSRLRIYHRMGAGVPTLYGSWVSGSNGGSLIVYRSGLTTGTYDGLHVRNATAATAGVPAQNPPRYAMSGQAWDTGSVSSKMVIWYMGASMTSGNPTTSELRWAVDQGIGTHTTQMSMSNAGVVRMLGNVAATSYTTGTLVITGGVGISQRMYVYGTPAAYFGAVSSDTWPIVTVGSHSNITTTGTPLAGSGNTYSCGATLTVGVNNSIAALYGRAVKSGLNSPAWSIGVLGVSDVAGTGTLQNAVGVYGQAILTSGGWAGAVMVGVHGSAHAGHASSTRYGGRFESSGGSTCYGVHASASGGTTTSFAGYFSGRVFIDHGSITVNHPTLGITGIWNNGALAFTTLVVDMTDTASAAATRLMDLKVGGGSRFYVDKTGNAYVAGKLTVVGAIDPTYISLVQGTIVAAQPIVSGTATWNNAAVEFSALRLNVTDTASLATSMLLDLQVGAAPKFQVDKTGKVSAYGGLYTAGSLTVDAGWLLVTNGDYSTELCDGSYAIESSYDATQFFYGPASGWAGYFADGTYSVKLCADGYAIKVESGDIYLNGGALTDNGGSGTVDVASGYFDTLTYTSSDPELETFYPTTLARAKTLLETTTPTDCRGGISLFYNAERHQLEAIDQHRGKVCRVMLEDIVDLGIVFSAEERPHFRFDPETRQVVEERRIVAPVNWKIKPGFRLDTATGKFYQGSAERTLEQATESA